MGEAASSLALILEAERESAAQLEAARSRLNAQLAWCQQYIAALDRARRERGRRSGDAMFEAAVARAREEAERLASDARRRAAEIETRPVGVLGVVDQMVALVLGSGRSGD